MALESSSASDGHYRRNTEPMTLKPNPLSNGLEARTPDGEMRIHIRGASLWASLWAYDHKIHGWVESSPYGIEIIGTTQTGPTRWEKRPG